MEEDEGEYSIYLFSNHKHSPITALEENSAWQIMGHY